MTIRWKKLAPTFAIIILMCFWPFINELFRPGFMSGIACVRRYPDGKLERDWGDSCYAPELPEAIVLKSK